MNENLIFAKAEVIDHTQNHFDKNMQITTEDLFAILNPIQKIFKVIKIISNYAQFMKVSPKGQIVDIDNLTYQEKEILFVLTKFYYRVGPRNSILYYEPDIYLSRQTNTKIATLLHELGFNNQIWIT